LVAERDRLLSEARHSGRRSDFAARIEKLQLAVHASRTAIRTRVERSVPSAAVEDVAAAAAVRAVAQIVKAAPRADTPAAFGAWLRQVVAREVADYWRSERPTVPLDLVDMRLQSIGGDPHESVRRREALRAAFEVVPRRHRGDVHRYVVLDRPAQEVCGPQLSRGHVYKAAERYRRRLRGLLQDV
jgi:DNA-directed RNA polymerase specialized sigma24 family protein